MSKLAPQEIRTFFISANAWQHRSIFQSDRMCELMISVLEDNRSKGRMLIHEFVIMPTHIHALLTPAPEVSLEKAVQFIKGGFSFRAKKELGFEHEVWQTSFTEHRVKDWSDYKHHRTYIWNNPVKAGLVSAPQDFRFSSAAGTFQLDPVPPGLKPHFLAADSQA